MYSFQNLQFVISSSIPFLSSYSFWFQVSLAWGRELRYALRMRRVKVWDRRVGRISVLCRKDPRGTNQAVFANLEEHSLRGRYELTSVVIRDKIMLGRKIDGRS